MSGAPSGVKVSAVVDPGSHLSVSERAARGKQARAVVPRTRHAEFAVPERDPIALLQEQAATRVPELVPIRYERMAVTPFTFFRGAALVMATDLATTPTSGFTVQCCGDAHLSNFGMFGSPERRLVFDINDFDETLPAPWEWDVKRLAASMEVSGRENGFSRKDRQGIAVATVRVYREAIRAFASMTNLDVWYSRMEMEQILPQILAQIAPKRRQQVVKIVSYARTRDRLSAYNKLTYIANGVRRIVADPPLLVPVSDLVPDDVEREEVERGIVDLLREYQRTLPSDRRELLEQYRFVDLAHKVVGVGSVGTRCWIALMLGRDDDDPLFLQVKQAERSVLERFAGKSKFQNQGERVVAGQRLMQAASDIFLGWQRVRGDDGTTRDFYVRQLRDWKAAVDVEALRPPGMRIYGELCAWALARAHARSGDRIAIASYLGASDTFDRAVAEFATSYADQNERDHAALLDARKHGVVPTEVPRTIGAPSRSA